MASTQKKTPHLTEALGGEKSPTGTLEPDHKMNPLHSGMAGSCENPSRAGAVDRRTYLGTNSEAPPGVAQPESLLYAAEVGTSYSNQPGNNVAISNWNYGGYYRPGAMCFADQYGDTYPSNARPLRNSADLSSCARSSKLRHREQRSSCSFDQRFTASKRHDSETDVKSFVNAHALVQPYFPPDELRHQPASYPRLSCEQNLSFLDFACRFPSPIQSSHSAVPHANLMQSELGGVPLTTHSDQYPVAAQPYFQQQVSSPLISGDVPAQSCSHSDNVASYFPQPSLSQLIRELHANPPPAYEGVQSPNRRFSSNGFFESNADSNLRRFSDICATSSPFNHLGTVPEHETIFGNFRECPENDVYTRVTLGPAMNSEGSLSYGIKGPPRSCMFRRRADIFRSHASGSSEKLDFEKLLELPQTGNDIKPLATITEIDVVGDECKKETARKASCSEVLSKLCKRGGPRECKCTVCGKMLARASTLKIHMRQHTGDRPFKCVTCAKTFAQAGLLQSHRRTHTGERPFTCSFCQKTFSHSSALKTHMRTHTGERPHKCQVVGCNMAFGDSSTLSKHARTHTGEKPYCCDICGKRFTQSGNMHKHKKGVHNIKNSSSCRKKSDLKKDMSVERTQAEIESESSTSQSESTLHALLSN